jgi:hypothetical protein
MKPTVKGDGLVIGPSYFQGDYLHSALPAITHSIAQEESPNPPVSMLGVDRQVQNMGFLLHEPEA